MEAADPILKIKIAPVFEILALAIVKKTTFTEGACKSH